MKHLREPDRDQLSLQVFHLPRSNFSLMLSVRLVGMCHVSLLLELGDLCKTAATSDVTTVIIVSILVIYDYHGLY